MTDERKPDPTAVCAVGVGADKRCSLHGQRFSLGCYVCRVLAARRGIALQRWPTGNVDTISARPGQGKSLFVESLAAEQTCSCGRAVSEHSPGEIRNRVCMNARRHDAD